MKKQMAITYWLTYLLIIIIIIKRT